jgi:hypothetical protein
MEAIVNMRIALLVTGLVPLFAAAQAMKPPADPGMAKPPADSGAVVTPPPVNDKSVATPPKNIDPKIDDPTDDIDRASRKKSEDKKKNHGMRRQQDAAPLKP